MREFLFKPHLHFVGVVALGFFAAAAQEANLPLWLIFMGGVAIAAANDLTKWRGK